MKKILFSFMTFLILILGSCQDSLPVDEIQASATQNINIDPVNEATNEIVAPDALSNDVISRLKAFNDSLYNSVEETNSVNGSNTLQFFKKILDINVADFLGRLEGAGYGIAIGGVAAGPEGAITGMVILAPLVGACRSYQAAFPNERSIIVSTFHQNSIASYIKMKEEIKEYSAYYPTRIKLRLPANKQTLQIEGAQHNIILDNLRKKRFSTTTPEEALKNGTITYTEYQCLRHSKLLTALSKVYPNYSTLTPYDFGEVPNSIIKLYRQVIKDTSRSYNDIETISNRYISEIFSAKELEESQKDNLSSSICVLASSVEYWNTFQ